jgi:hypothetical protein
MQESYEALDIGHMGIVVPRIGNEYLNVRHGRLSHRPSGYPLTFRSINTITFKKALAFNNLVRPPQVAVGFSIDDKDCRRPRA